MRETKGSGPAKVVRIVLVERHARAGQYAGLALYARAMWADNRRAEIKMWAAAGAPVDLERVPESMRTRSRSLASCRDPMLAQEWAWAQWDEYRADVEAALAP
jgi:hypothetical protein